VKEIAKSSLNPRLHSLHRSAVYAARIRDRNYETTYVAGEVKLQFLSFLQAVV